jgi:hypothetical protein
MLRLGSRFVSEDFNNIQWPLKVEPLAEKKSDAGLAFSRGPLTPRRLVE